MRGVVHRSRGVREILGIEPEDLAPVVDAWRERIHPRDLETATEADRACAHRRPRLDHDLSHPRRPRALPLDARARPHPAQRARRSAAGDRMLRGRFGDQTPHGPARPRRNARRKMGGWEYSYSTLELTWTEEMFRIFETTPGGLRRVLGIDACAVHAGVAASGSTRPGDARS